MAWTVTIGEGSTARTISANFVFPIDLEKTLNNEGVESVDWQIKVSGDIVDPSPSVVGATFFDYLTEVADKHAAVKIVFAQDAVVRRTLSPEDGFLGPYVVSFRSTQDEDGGTGESKWSYEFTIVYRSKALSTQGQNPVFDSSSSLSITKKNGNVVRKVWKTSVRSTSADSAEASVRSFKPSEKFITEEVEVFFEDHRATGVWVWEAEDKGIKTWRCSIFYYGGDGSVIVPRAGIKAKPARFAAQNEPVRVEVEGEVVAFVPDIVIPSDHFSESEDLWREPRLEKFQRDSVIHDEAKGEYIRRYNEVYFCVGTIPAPNHSGKHNLIDTGKAPADGGISR